MYDYAAAGAKLRGLELIAEAAADRRAAALRRARRRRDESGTSGLARPGLDERRGHRAALTSKLGHDVAG